MARPARAAPARGQPDHACRRPPMSSAWVSSRCRSSSAACSRTTSSCSRSATSLDIGDGTAAACESRPLSAGLRDWLARALQFDERTGLPVAAGSAGRLRGDAREGARLRHDAGAARSVRLARSSRRLGRRRPAVPAPPPLPVRPGADCRVDAERRARRARPAEPVAVGPAPAAPPTTATGRDAGAAGIPLPSLRSPRRVAQPRRHSRAPSQRRRRRRAFANRAATRLNPVAARARGAGPRRSRRRSGGCSRRPRRRAGTRRRARDPDAAGRRARVDRRRRARRSRRSPPSSPRARTSSKCASADRSRA